MKKSNLSDYETSSVLRENVDRTVVLYELDDESDLRLLSNEVKKDLRKGTVKLMRVIVWD